MDDGLLREISKWGRGTKLGARDGPYSHVTVWQYQPIDSDEQVYRICRHFTIGDVWHTSVDRDGVSAVDVITYLLGD